MSKDKLTIVLSDEIKTLSAMFKENGFSLYMVGGCVRDAIRGFTPHDYDFTTNATPQEMQALCKAHKLAIYPTGIEYGTMTIAIEDELFEVTTFRKDVEEIDHRKAKVEFATTLEEDLARRDFTINALACDCDTLEIIDLYNAVNDMNYIMTVGDANQRFEEDYLRIVRMYRFAIADANYQIDAKTKAAADGLIKAGCLNNLPKERMHAEIVKMLSKPEVNMEELRQAAPLFRWFLNEPLPFWFEQVGHFYSVMDLMLKATQFFIPFQRKDMTAMLEDTNIILDENVTNTEAGLIAAIRFVGIFYAADGFDKTKPIDVYKEKFYALGFSRQEIQLMMKLVQELIYADHHVDFDLVDAANTYGFDEIGVAVAMLHAKASFGSDVNPSEVAYAKAGFDAVLECIHAKLKKSQIELGLEITPNVAYVQPCKAILFPKDICINGKDIQDVGLVAHPSETKKWLLMAVRMIRDGEVVNEKEPLIAALKNHLN